MIDDGTIGSLASGATSLASASTQDLFVLMWTNLTNTVAAVSGGRGASAAADFAANKTIALPKALGRAFASAGSGSGLTTRTLGSTAGAESIALSVGELPSHSHSNTLTDPGHNHDIDFQFANGGPSGAINSVFATGQISQTRSATTNISISNASTGGGTAHINVQPTLFINWMIKL